MLSGKKIQNKRSLILVYPFQDPANFVCLFVFRTCRSASGGWFVVTNGGAHNPLTSSPDEN